MDEVVSTQIKCNTGVPRMMKICRFNLGAIRHCATQARCRLVLTAMAGLGLMMVFATPARAQHSDWLLGSYGLLGGTQPPPGIYYSNIWSYYQASGSSFVSTRVPKCGPLGKACLSFDANASGSLNLFVDQNTFIWTSHKKIFGANYGLFIDIPFAIAEVTGSGAIQPNLTIGRFSPALPPAQGAGALTKGSITDIYVEPINLGWHLAHFDAIVSSGFFAPAGPYNPKASLNIGYGHWTGVFGIGGVEYPDEARTWSLSLYVHYLIYAAQMGRPYTLGYELPFEWGVGKTFSPNGKILTSITPGAVGYAQWQVTPNRIDVNPVTQIGKAAVNQLESINSFIYAVGPAVTALTKYGLFSLSYYEEFGAEFTPSGRQLMFSFAF